MAGGTSRVLSTLYSQKIPAADRRYLSAIFLRNWGYRHAVPVGKNSRHRLAKPPRPAVAYITLLRPRYFIRIFQQSSFMHINSGSPCSIKALISPVHIHSHAFPDNHPFSLTSSFRNLHKFLKKAFHCIAADQLPFPQTPVSPSPRPSTRRTR